MRITEIVRLLPSTAFDARNIIVTASLPSVPLLICNFFCGLTYSIMIDLLQYTRGLSGRASRLLFPAKFPSPEESEKMLEYAKVKNTRRTMGEGEWERDADEEEEEAEDQDDEDDEDEEEERG